MKCNNKSDITISHTVQYSTVKNLITSVKDGLACVYIETLAIKIHKHLSQQWSIS